MEVDQDLPPLLESGEGALTHPSFHESSTNVSIADSAAATQGSESFRDFSDRGQNSNSDSSSEAGDSSGGSFVESASNTSNNKPISCDRGGFRESELSSDDDWVEDGVGEEHMKNIKYIKSY